MTIELPSNLQIKSKIKAMRMKSEIQAPFYYQAISTHLLNRMRKKHDTKNAMLV